MTIRRNKSIESEFIISGTPKIIKSTASTTKVHYFTDSTDSKYYTEWLSVRNTGTSGSLYVSFVSGGLATSQSFLLNAGESFNKPLMTDVVYVSSSAAQPYEICAARTNLYDSSSSLPSNISNLFAWWRADSGITLDTGVSSWESRVNGHTFVQTTSTQQPVLVNSQYLFNEKALSFDGTNDSMTCTGSPALWSFLNNGSGSTVFVALATPDPLVASNTILSTTVGLEGIWVVTTDTGFFGYNLYSSAGNIYSNYSTTYRSNTATIVDMSFLDGGSPEVTVRKNDVVTNTGTAGVPTNNTPDHALRIGALGAYSYGKLHIAEIIVYNRVLTLAEKQQVYLYLTQHYNTTI